MCVCVCVCVCVCYQIYGLVSFVLVSLFNGILTIEGYINAQALLEE